MAQDRLAAVLVAHYRREFCGKALIVHMDEFSFTVVAGVVSGAPMRLIDQVELPSEGS